MCSTFSYLPIIFFRGCLTRSFYRGHSITTPNTAQTYRGNPSNFIPPKKNWWSHLIIPAIFPWDKKSKNPWLPRSAHRFCNAQGEPEVSDDACGIAGLTVGAVHLLSSIWKSNYTHPQKKNWTNMDTSDTPKNDGKVGKNDEKCNVLAIFWGYLQYVKFAGFFFHNCYMIWSNRMAWSWIESKPSYGSLITLSLHLRVSTLEILQQSAADDQYESTVAELPSCNCGSKEARRLLESSLLE